MIVNTPYSTPSMTLLGCYGCLTHTNISMAKTIILSHVIVTQTTKLHVACARYLGVCVGYGFSHDLLLKNAAPYKLHAAARLPLLALKQPLFPHSA